VVGSKAKVEGARFRVVGPGLAGNELDAVDDGSGSFRTTFTFMQAGRFEMSFVARADGSAVRASRALAVEAAKPSATAPSSKPTASPPPTTQPPPAATATAPPAATTAAPASGPFI
jgi:hypothetical protein